MRSLRDFVLLTIPTLIFCVICGEILFRFVIPASEQPWGYYDPADRIAKFDLGQGTGVFTIGNLAQQRARWRINNAGWNSDIDYFPPDQRTKPLIAIIGDSFIEAFQVNIEDSIAARLRERLRGQYDVYGFGKSGAPLSQYLQMSRYVTKSFSPDVIIINVIHNDFDESLRHVYPMPYFLQLETTETEIKESRLPSTAISAKTTTKLVFRSAIVRYLWSNLKYGELWTETRPRNDERKQVMAQGLAESLHFKTKLYKATDYIIRTMREEITGKKLVFMIDAPRGDIYNGRIQNSQVRWMNDLLAELCRRYQAPFIDLTEPFLEKYQKDRLKLNSVYDGHWNEEGHRYAAEVLYRNLVKYGIVKEVQ